jgi:hypothetical protein
MDCKDISLHCKDTSPPPFSKTLAPARALYPGTDSPSPSPQQGRPPQYVLEQQQSPPTEPVRLIPNRRAPSPTHFRDPAAGAAAAAPRPKLQLQVDHGARFNNPAMQTSKTRPSFRTPIGACFFFSDRTNEWNVLTHRRRTDLRGRPWR